MDLARAISTPRKYLGVFSLGVGIQDKPDKCCFRCRQIRDEGHMPNSQELERPETLRMRTWIDVNQGIPAHHFLSPFRASTKSFPNQTSKEQASPRKNSSNWYANGWQNHKHG